MSDNQLEIIFGKESKKLKNKIFVRDEDFETSRGEDYKLAIEFLKDFNKKSINGKTIMEYLYFNDVSYWWFIYQSLVPEVKNQINFISNFLNFLKTVKPSKVKLENNFERFEIIKQICNKLNIDFSYSKFRLLRYNSKIKSKNSIQERRYKRIHEKKIETRKSLVEKNYNSIPDFSNKILFTVSTNFRRLIFDFQDATFKRGEFLTSNLFDMFDHSELLGIDLDYTFQGTPSVLRERFSESFSWIPLEIILTDKTRNNTELIQQYKKLIANSNFQNLFSFMGIKFWSNLEFFFDKMYFTPFLPFYSSLVQSIFKQFSTSKPKSVFIPYETGSFALAIISACKSLGIITFGIQHGHIYQYNPMYSYGEIISKSNPYGFPIPDYLLLFGNSTKNLLVDNGYPEENLIVFGNPSLFNLNDFQSKFDLKKSLNKFSIHSDEHVILFTTGKLQRAYPEVGKFDYDEKIAEELIKKFGNNGNYRIIIKPHPTEENIDIYEELIKKNSSKNVIISQDNIFELISLSSIIISVFSTTMYDALCFDKPVMRIKFSENERQVIDLSQIITTSTLEEMSSKIVDLLENFDPQAFSKKSKEFIKEHFGLPEEEPEKILKSLIDK